MKLKLISDLHFEFHRDGGKSFVNSLQTSNTDVLVIAGDLTTKPETIEPSLKLFCDKFKSVIYVLGNHELWHSNFMDIEEAANNASSKISNLHFLNNSTCTIDNQRFIGATMWFPENSVSLMLKHGWSDFLNIRDNSSRIFYENIQTVEYFNKNVRSDDIVITHHLPSYLSVHQAYENEASNCFFVCDMEKLINERQPKYWFHGHTHESMDYTINATRIVCNPFGYHGYTTNKNFYENKVITL